MFLRTDFRDYVEICFKRYGKRVKNWITFNEPYSYAIAGYATGEYAPGRCSASQNSNCTAGDSATEPYLVAHHQLLAHAAAVKLYRQKYKVLFSCTGPSFFFLHAIVNERKNKSMRWKIEWYNINAGVAKGQNWNYNGGAMDDTFLQWECPPWGYKKGTWLRSWMVSLIFSLKFYFFYYLI